MGVGGAIGTALFISIGGALPKSGPLSLLLGYAIYCLILACVNNCLAEMTVLYPVPGGFIRLAGKWVDDAFGFMAGPFNSIEITAINMVLSFWRDDVPTGAVCGACIAAYALLSVFAVKVYGEAEFWGSSGKIALLIMLFLFTFITMVGGNPQHDAFGFRAWRDPGPMAEYLHTGDLGRFEGVLAALWTASFTFMGPEFINLIAAEAKRPRVHIKNAFKVIYWLPSVLVFSLPITTRPLYLCGTEAASPFFLAMENMKVAGFPHLINALLITTIFSAGNTYMYCASRKRCPDILCDRRDVLSPTVPSFPWKWVSQALTWLSNLITAGAIIDYIVVCATYIFFYRACQAQSPYSASIGLTGECLIDVSNVFTHHTMLILAPVLYIAWKLSWRTRVVKPEEANLIWERPMIDAYEVGLTSQPKGFWAEILETVGWRRVRQEEQASNSC
ncbi:AAT family amino acid transporter [Aspergillus flavus]|uniref:AAT family amino acid transporter n=1 Tax=Aspergillus flavus (strain ATCC 200026 / FGSC A1120 / IAM 13836 / NRRL 3357 / JCM 12722 / SRRC 167) TaxID=332952 RepID=A0A7U2N0D2_ASPFN|nr:AAT family amino acid transporter [Aspergillus flavus]